jgi:predicted O-methyltransferase YrrM
VWDYKADFDSAMVNVTISEGSIGDEEAQFFSNLVRGKGRINVAQVGLGLGKSAWAFLAANADCHLLTFDNGSHAASGEIASRISKAFPQRHEVVWGDSKAEIPHYNTTIGVDASIAFIDGGHDYDSCMSDLRNLYAPGRLVLTDDYWPYHDNGRSLHGVYRAWEDGIKTGLLKQISYHTEVHPEWHTVTNPGKLPWAWVVGVYL